MVLVIVVLCSESKFVHSPGAGVCGRMCSTVFCPSQTTGCSATLRLNKAVEALARAEGAKCLDFLHRRIRDSLKRIVGHSIEFCLALEESKGRLHLHGGLACAASEYELVRRALKTAGGVWPKGMRQFQLVMRKLPTARWTGYAVKQAFKARPGHRQLMVRYGARSPLWTVTFDGRAVSATHPLRAKAKVLHAAAIREVVAFRRAAKVARRPSPV